VAARLRALQHVLGMSDQDMANAIGTSRPRWSNYVSRKRKNSRMINIDGVRQLKQQFSVTADWVFLGDASTLDHKLRLKLTKALANPQPPKRPGRQRQAPVDTFDCPRCAETIKRTAKVCRFCGHEFGSLPPVPVLEG
jgi:transcriptional regulator with XRE-family HTH domain